jgi:hypothetical protein
MSYALLQSIAGFIATQLLLRVGGINALRRGAIFPAGPEQPAHKFRSFAAFAIDPTS